VAPPLPAKAFLALIAERAVAPRTALPKAKVA
jgi:hypothetical protein